MKTIKPMKCTINKDGENKNILFTELRNHLAEGWKVGKVINKADLLDKLQLQKEKVIEQLEAINGAHII